MRDKGGNPLLAMAWPARPVRYTEGVEGGGGLEKQSFVFRESRLGVWWPVAGGRLLAAGSGVRAG